MTTNKYKHVFFDLDHTLWDFETNSTEVIIELLSQNGLHERLNIHVPTFLQEYKKINEELWREHREGKIDRKVLRSTRFYRTFLLFGLDDMELAIKTDADYLERSPFKQALFPNTISTLDYLKKKYPLHLITNGFEDTQQIKLKSSGLDSYFEHVITSDRSGFNKPQKEIFEFAFAITGAQPSESIMIGDNLEIDVIGAANVGMDQVYFNPNRETTPHKATFEIHDLKELTNIL